MKLRDYQLQCLHAIRDGYRAGTRRQLVCLPTGTGKTVIFANFPGFFQMKHRMLVLAHREELLDQAAAKIRSINPGLTVGVEQAQRHAPGDVAVVVASVATLGRRNSERLRRLNPDEFHMIVVDEAHHAAAESWRRVLDHFGVFEDDSRKLLVGFTATPKRADGVGLDEVFEEIVFARDLPTMIARGFLSPVAAYRVETNVDLNAVRTRMGDFASAQLSSAVNVAERNRLIVDVYHERLAGRKAVCFCVDVAHATNLSAAFNDAGIQAAALTGSTPANERQDNLAAFHAGDLRVLTNCMVLTEGYDEPSIEGIILARPTKSTGLYTQMIGRGTRLHSGKEKVVIIDIVDATRRHSLATLPGLFGFSDRFDMEGKTTTQLDQIIRWVERHRPWVRPDEATSVSELRHKCQYVDLMGLSTPREIRSASEFAWLAVGPDSYRLPLGRGESISITQTLLAHWEVLLQKSGRFNQTNAQGDTNIGTAADLSTALDLAETFVRTEREDATRLVTRKVRWRNEAPTEKQLEILHRHKLECPPELSRGDASRLIGMLTQ